MLILALESSAKPASASVYNQPVDGVGKLLGQYYLNSGFSHSHTLMVMVESLLRSLDLNPSDIDLFAVAHGPGSFTGVRIGVSAIKGLAFGADKPVCGVSTLEAMARQSIREDTLICPVMDARRRQVYNALFRCENDTLIRLREDRAISIDELAEDLLSFGIDNNKNNNSIVSFMPIGDGAELVSSQLSDVLGLKIITPPPITQYQSACGVALCALAAETMPAAKLEPVYLRPSQAERVRNEKVKQLQERYTL